MKKIILLFTLFIISVYPQKLSESFESTTFPPSGWTTQFFGGSGWSRETTGTIPPGWSNGSITTPSGGGSAVAYCTYDYNSTTEFNDQWLITSQILSVQQTDTLYFVMRRQFQYADTLEIWVSQSTNSINDFTYIGSFLFSTTTDTNWFLYKAPVGQFVNPGANIYIAFREYVTDNITNGGALSIDLVSVSGGTSNYPSTIQLSKSYTFGDVTKNTSYRLIGLPGNNNLPISSFTSGTHKKDWNVFYDNGAEPIALLEFNGQATFNFTPGKGFWALSRNPITVPAQQVNTVTLTGDAFSISLHNGWNIISNPFEKNVNVADIRAANGLAQNAIFHNFNGSFPAGGATTMVPYEGYYFFNDGTHPTLDIPYPFTSNLPKTNEQPYFLSEESLKLKLSSDEFSSEIMIGFETSASNDYDDMDYFAPPGNFEELRINLVNKNLSTSYKQLFIEHRPEIGEGQLFELQIKNTTNKNANLSINGIERFA
ncbi:MAG: hypothetical protein Q7S39_07360, partial [Ignavibacteria bacterium]|nr:hypothetical protein [Ignavibacteria bacterium]